MLQALNLRVLDEDSPCSYTKLQSLLRLNSQDCLKNLGLLELKTEISSDIFLYVPVTYLSQLSCAS